jgi:uncharacterized repeat protein (TIGR01451 family)
LPKRKILSGGCLFGIFHLRTRIVFSIFVFANQYFFISKKSKSLMRTKHLLFVAALAGIAGATWSFQNQKANQKNASPVARTAAPPPTYSPALGQYGAAFAVNNLPPFIYDIGTPASWKVFFNLGDGRYWKGTKNEFNQMSFANKYWTPGNHVAYAETTPIYDDDNNPSMRTADITVTPSGSNPTSQDFLVTMNGREVKLDCSREPKPKDIITYIITYEHNEACNDAMDGSMTFTYDEDVLDYAGADNGLHYSIANQEAKDNITNDGIVAITFNNLAKGEQRNVFLHFTVANVPLSEPFDIPWVAFRGEAKDSSPNCTVNDTSNLARQVLVEEHDPNHKEASLSYISQTGGEIEYTVHFQNDGDGPAQTVFIDDELGIYLSGSVTHTGSSHPVKLSTSSPTQINSNPKTWRWVFNNMNLRGTHEADYGKTFSEEETKGYIKFKVTADTLVPCNAIINRARIVFGCNPAINTDFAVTRITCTVLPAAPPPDSVVPPSIMATLQFCPDTGFQYLTGKIGLAPGSSVGTLLSAADLSAIGTGWDSYQWYPTRGLSSAWVLNPSLDIARTDTFALVVSKQCLRRMYLVPITTTAPPPTSPILVEDVPGDCWAHLVVSGGMPPYSYLWGYNGTTVSGSADLDLAGKSNVSVTVTDSSTCTTVFVPNKGKCGGCIFDDWSWLERSAVASAVAALIFFIFRFLRKR